MTRQSKLVLGVLVLVSVLFTLGIGLGRFEKDPGGEPDRPKCEALKCRVRQAPAEEPPAVPRWVEGMHAWLGPLGEPIGLQDLASVACERRGDALLVPENGECTLKIDAAASEEHRRITLQHPGTPAGAGTRVEVRYEPEGGDPACTPLAVGGELTIPVFEQGGSMILCNETGPEVEILFE